MHGGWFVVLPGVVLAAHIGGVALFSTAAQNGYSPDNTEMTSSDDDDYEGRFDDDYP